MSGSLAAARTRHLPPGAAAITGVVALLALLAGVVTIHLPDGDANRQPGPLAVAAVVAAVTGAGATVRWPVPGAVLVAVALGVYVGRGYPNGPVYLTGLAAGFLLGRRVGRVLTLAGLVAIELGLVIGWLVARHNGALVAFYPGWVAAAAAVGATLHNRRLSRTENNRRRLAEERLRIARDLHDGVAHAMATINVQAAAAAHVIDQRPAAAKDALTAIARASGTVLDELNAMLTLLRDADEPAALAPTPGLAEVADLVDGLRAAGRDGRCEINGDPAGVSPAVATAAYRIVQESLTNVLKHSDARTVRVVICVDDDRVQVTVADDGTTSPTPTRPGNGLRGMHERAEATGGRLTAGPGDAGFTVRAEWTRR